METAFNFYGGVGVVRIRKRIMVSNFMAKKL